MTENTDVDNILGEGSTTASNDATVMKGETCSSRRYSRYHISAGSF